MSKIGLVALSGIALAVVVGLIGLLQERPVDASQHSAERSFSATSVAPGGEVVVTISATGFGAGGRIVETLPAGFDYVSSDPEGATFDANDRTVKFTLLAGESTFEYTVTAPSTEDDYTFSGILKDFDQAEEVIGGPDTITVAAATTEPPTDQDDGGGDDPGPTASRSFSAESVQAGSELEVTITAANYGFGGQIVETLPEGFGYVSSDPAGATFDADERTVAFTLVDETTFKYTVTAPTRSGGYRFSGVLKDSDRSDHTIGGPSRVNVQPAPGPTASRSFSPPSVSRGGSLEVTIAVANYGFGGQIVETVPSGFDYVSSDPAGATFDADERTVTFTLVDEAAFKYTVTAPDSDGRYRFSGVLKDSDRKDHSIGGPSTVTVEAAPGPTASRSFSPTSVSKGGSLVVTITAANYGFGGQIVETLPTGFEYVSSDPAGATFDADGRTVTFTLVDETTFKYTVTAPDRDAHFRFSGVLKDSDRKDHTIGGSSRITVGRPRATATPTPRRSTTTVRPDPTSTATPTPTVTPTPTPAPATATPTPAPATATPTPAPATATPTATATPPATVTPTATPTATAVPAATATPEPTLPSTGDTLPGWMIPLALLGALMTIGGVLPLVWSSPRGPGGPLRGHRGNSRG